MSLSISAPVGDKKRITKPDPKKPNQKFLPVKNSPADVELVQLMLVANGYNGPVDGKASPGLIKAIRSFQKAACGFKKPDGIVDPGLNTWQAGLPKLKAKMAADMKELENRYEIKDTDGKIKVITKAEFEKRQKETLKGFVTKANGMIGQVECWVDFCQGAEETMQGQETVMMQLTEFAVRWANEKAEPPWTKVYAADTAAKNLKSAASASSPNWDKILKADKTAVKVYGAGKKAFEDFIKARIDTASGIIGKLEVVRETSFAVVEVYLTAQIMARGNMSPAAAHAAAAASTEAMKSSAGQLGEHLAGNKVTWEGAAKKVAMDTAFAAAAGAIGGKLSSGMATKFAGSFSVKFGGKYLGKEAAEKFVTAFLKSGAGQAFIENLAKETFMLSKKAFEKGTLTKKDFEEALTKAVTAGLMKGGIGKALQGFDKAIPGVSEKSIKLLMEKNIMKGLTGDLEKMFDYKLVENILKEDGDEIIGKVLGTLSGKYVDAKVKEVMDGASGNETAKQLEKMLADKLRQDKELRKELQRLAKVEVIKNAKKLEGAK